MTEEGLLQFDQKARNKLHQVKGSERNLREGKKMGKFLSFKCLNFKSKKEGASNDQKKKKLLKKFAKSLPSMVLDLFD